jgi:uncharacterized protein YydD (DUF2326 family)
MFLKRLYSEPLGLFNTGKEENPHVFIFKDGVNFIFGKKSNVEDTKDSLNGVGKSTLLNLIDFCLLSNYSQKDNPRLYKERKRLGSFSIILEFELNNELFIIKRDIENHKKPQFGFSLNNLETFDISDLKKELFKLLFDNKFYLGILSSDWYRLLMAFYVKIHKRKGDLFQEPTEFIKHQNILSLNRILFFLINIDNTLICKNYDLQKDVADRAAGLRKVKKLIQDVYNVNINKVESELNKTQNEIKKVDAAIKSFELANQHENVEKEMNELTASIKEFLAQNYWDKEKIKSYKESYELKDLLTPQKLNHVKKLYGEMSELLGNALSATLQEAVAFRKALSASREDFLSREIIRIEEIVQQRNILIKTQDVERAKLFKLLQSKKAFNDLTDAFEKKGELQTNLSNLQSNYKTYKDLELERIEWEGQENKIIQEIITFVDENEQEKNEFEAVFHEVYNRLYPHSESSGFAITTNPKTQAKTAIDIKFPDDESKGKNSGRTLVFDLSILIFSIINDRNLPKFIIHDGIFDGMDKAQFVETYHYIQSLQKEGKRLQYFTTINEEGDLKDNFGRIDKLSVEKIAEEAVAVFTPNRKLWNIQ